MKAGFAGGGVEGGGVEGSAFEMEFFFGLVDLGDLLIAGDDFRDHLANVFVLGQGVKVDWAIVPQDVAGEACDDFDFAFGSGVSGDTAFAEPDVVEHGFLGGGLDFFVAGEDRQDEGFFGAAFDMADVEGGAEVNSHIEGVEGIGGESRIRGGSVEVPAEAEYKTYVSLFSLFETAQGIEALCGGQLDLVFALEFIEDGLLEFGGDAD